MHRILIAVAAAGVLFAAVPASAEQVGVSIGERGVRIGVDGDRDVRRDRRHTDGRRVRGECSEVTVKKRMPDGTVIIKKSQRC